MREGCQYNEATADSHNRTPAQQSFGIGYKKGKVTSAFIELAVRFNSRTFKEGRADLDQVNIQDTTV